MYAIGTIQNAGSNRPKVKIRLYVVEQAHGYMAYLEVQNQQAAETAAITFL